jgi:nucleotide sugar dehydrogenase
MQVLTAAYGNGRLSIDTAYSVLHDCEAVLITIPLSVRNTGESVAQIEFASFDRCLSELAEIVHSRMLVLLETTVPVGTCRKRLVSIFSAAGKEHGRDYLLAYSPERVMSGSMLNQLESTPKIVGGLTDDALAAAADLYRSFLPAELIETVSSLEHAEMIKLTAMVARDINIALINQIAMYCDAAQIDVREVLKHVNTDGYSHMLKPGIGVGGHCTPVYPHFLISNFSESDLTFTLAKEARKINDGTPNFFVDSICKEFSSKDVLILGLAFRPGVKEHAFSPAFAVQNALKSAGIHTYIHDPLFTEDELKDLGFVPISDIYSRPFDAVILVTDHREFQTLEFAKLARQGCKVFLDGRNAFDHQSITACGIAYRGIGTGPIETKILSHNA